MYYVNKIVGAFLNPLGFGLLLLMVAGVIGLLGHRGRFGKIVRMGGWWLAGLAFVWLWFWSLGLTERWIGLSLEREFPPMMAEAMPTVDAIVVLGGGTWANTNACPYAELFQGADRAWHGARLYKAGKAPRVFVTNESDARVMVELGVPQKAISGPSPARNTEEEARFIAEAMKQGTGNGEQGTGGSRVLLVTSAWHMRRAKLMYERYASGVEVIPAAADHEFTTLYARPVEFKEFVPDPGALAQNAVLMKEIIAYYGYKWLRR